MKKIKELTKKDWMFLIFGIITLVSTLVMIIHTSVTWEETLNRKTLKNPNDFSMIEVFAWSNPIFFFTTQSNIFLGIMLVVFPLSKKENLVKQFFFASVALITITFVIYWALISWTSDWSRVLDSINSLLTHGINPIFGFIALWFVRKEIKISRKTLLYSSLYLFGYFLFAFVLYFATYGNKNHWETGETLKLGAKIYGFLDFANPLFYKGGNLALIVFLDITMFAIALALPLGMSLFWKAIYKMDMDSLRCKKKQSKHK